MSLKEGEDLLPIFISSFKSQYKIILMHTADPFEYSRRTFVKNTGILMAASTMVTPDILFSATPSRIDTAESSPKKLGIALVGLGNYAMGQLAHLGVAHLVSKQLFIGEKK